MDFEFSMLIFWLAALVILIVIEAVTAQMVTIWFAAGAAAALIAEFLGAEIWLQWVIFVVVSAITLVATRPLVKKLTKTKLQPTNADRCIGRTAVVVEDIDNINGKGLVRVDGVVWTARSSDGKIYKKDECVRVEEISGVKLIVKQ